MSPKNYMETEDTLMAYITPELEMITFTSEDVITTSLIREDDELPPQT